MNGGVIKYEDDAFLKVLPIFLVVSFEWLLKINQEHQPFSTCIRSFPHLAKVDALIVQSADCCWWGAVRIFKYRIYFALLWPRVELGTSRIEGNLIDPNESAIPFHQGSEEASEDLSVLDDVWAFWVSRDLLNTLVAHVQISFQNLSDCMKLQASIFIDPLSFIKHWSYSLDVLTESTQSLFYDFNLPLPFINVVVSFLNARSHHTI